MFDSAPDPLRGLSEILLGQTLPGNEGRRYPLQRLIGEGGQGWVFRATWNGSIEVVVKILRPDAVSQESLARFQREAQVLRMLSQQPTPNPHIVRFYDHAYASVQVPSTGQSWELPFTVLEFVEGETLASALERPKPAGIGLERARRILSHMVLALGDVHARNVVHRDLKPSNVLLSSPGGREIAKVTDFGLAKLLDPGMQRTAHLAGATVGYAPPEQFEEGNLRVGPQTDVFSLAAIFYELVTGKAAFPFHPDAHPLLVVARILSQARPALARVAETLPQQLAERPDVVAAVDGALSRALSPDPRERHSSVGEFYGEIEQALGALSGTPILPTGAQRGAAGAVGAAEAVGAVGGVRAVIVRPSAPPPSPDRVSNPGVPGAISYAWRVVTGSMRPDTFWTIAVAHGGARALGLGPHGPAEWWQGQWVQFDAGGVVDASTLRTAAWSGDRVVLAGASSVVVAIGPRGPTAYWRIHAPETVFHRIYLDARGTVLVGERSTDHGPVGVVAEIFSDPRGGPAWGLTDLSPAGPLRAATRLGTDVLVCGDGGFVAVVPSNGGRTRGRRVCGVGLLAVATMGDGTAVTAGQGAYTFRIWPTLDCQLEATETQRDLFAIALGPDGAPWSGGLGGRVLRRGPKGWFRVGAEGCNARVLALQAVGERVLAFCDDGMVLEATPCCRE